MLLTTPGAPRAPALGLRKGADFCVSSRHAATIMNQGKAPAIRFTSPRTNASLAFIYLTDLVTERSSRPGRSLDALLSRWRNFR